MKIKSKVLIAGIGGASLGTEICKSLTRTGEYTIFGCDISKHAYGHYQEGFAETFVIDRENYVGAVHELCLQHDIRAVIPGGEGPLSLLGQVMDVFQKSGIHIAANSPEVVATCIDKQRLFERLEELNILTPKTFTVEDVTDLDDIPIPCVVKPATGTGGSHLVFLASDHAQASLYVSYLLNNGNKTLVQEYIPEDEGEFTVGVLSLPNGRLFGSMAMRRMFHAKLSVAARTDTGLISSGYSQGLIDDFPEVRKAAEEIALSLGSHGPVNIQGRMKDGVFTPFEINPRFSASTYLRALAGFNEIDIFLKALFGEPYETSFSIRPGYYLRSLTESVAPVVEGAK